MTKRFAPAKGFTLAEVLITLGIIGVVAALTLPNLIANYQKKTYVEGLKVGVSIFEQGFKKAMADDGVDKPENTNLWKYCSDSADTKSECVQELNKYFKVAEYGSSKAAIKDCKENNSWHSLNNKSKCAQSGEYYGMHLANGMFADLDVYSAVGDRAAGITIDINGDKGPNTWGRDVFSLSVLNDGRVVGSGSRASAENYAKYNNIDFNETNYKQDLENGCRTTSTGDDYDYSYNCSGRVIDEGWVMNY